MTIIVEDGTGLANAESYISVADADAYHAKRNNAAWGPLSTPVKEALLIKASEYIDQTYGLRWQGYKLKATQALTWPRTGVYVESEEIASDSLPVQVVRACAELALRANSEDLAPDLTQGIKKEVIEGIETEYDTTTPQQKRYQAVDALLGIFIAVRGPVHFERS